MGASSSTRGRATSGSSSTPSSAPSSSRARARSRSPTFRRRSSTRPATGTRDDRALRGAVGLPGGHRAGVDPQALDATRWNKQAAAALLGLRRPTLYSKMRKHNIPQRRS
ncbi:MAG: hypothetical protein FJZ38_12765 [Candidatus Rokubacteria bacterium]|nr:hypothetical protein [Candidatus Rokubacteria bacterium]